MYRSPITVITDQLKRQVEAGCENAVVEAVHNIGVIADKEELLKALKYERNQYNLGYAEGYSKAIDVFSRQCKGDLVCQIFGLRPVDIDRIAEKMKGGSEWQQ